MSRVARLKTEPMPLDGSSVKKYSAFADSLRTAYANGEVTEPKLIEILEANPRLAEAIYELEKGKAEEDNAA